MITGLSYGLYKGMLDNFLAVIPNIEDDHEWSLGGAEVLERNFRTVAENSRKILYYSSAKCEELLGFHSDKTVLKDIPSEFAGLCGFQAANARIAAEAAVMLYNTLYRLGIIK